MARAGQLYIEGQWAGWHEAESKVWAGAWGTDETGSAIYMAIWRREPGGAMVGQVKAEGEGHYARKISEKQRKGYDEIEFEALTPEYVPSFRHQVGSGRRKVYAVGEEAVAIARHGYPAFGRNQGQGEMADGGFALQLGVVGDLSPDPLVHGAKLLEMLLAAGASANPRRFLLGYQRAKIRLEVAAEYSRRKAQRQAAAVLLGDLRLGMQALLQA